MSYYLGYILFFMLLAQAYNMLYVKYQKISSAHSEIVIKDNNNMNTNENIVDTNKNNTNISENNLNKKDNEKIIVFFKGERYDISDFLIHHPGGKKVLQINNGNEIEDIMIENQHSINAYNILNKYKINQ